MYISENDSSDEEMEYDCDKCKKQFSDVKTYCRHLKTCLENSDPIKCPDCRKRLTSIKALKYHLVLNECVSQSGAGQKKIKLNNDTIFTESESAFNKFLQVFTFTPEPKYNDSNEFFNKFKNDFKELFVYVLKSLKNFKFQICLHVNFTRDIGEHASNQTGYFASVTRPIGNIDLFDKIFNKTVRYR